MRYMDEQGRRYRQPRNRYGTGVILLLIGAILLAKESGVFFPPWVLTWQAGLIVLGIFVGIRQGFRGAGWLIMILVGSLFMFDSFYPDFTIRRYTWPVFLMIIGIAFILRPRTRGYRDFEKPIQRKPEVQPLEDKTVNRGASDSFEDYIDVVSVLGGVKKNVFSKNFKGGESSCFMGGAEINLTNADIQGRVVLELNQVFGGTKIIIPSNWDIKMDVMNILGGVDDKRLLHNVIIDPNKVLVLKGTSVFGGIDIRSY